MNEQIDINHYKDLLRIYRRNIQHSIQEAERLKDTYIPHKTINDIENSRQQIQKIKNILKDLGSEIEDQEFDSYDVALIRNIRTKRPRYIAIICFIVVFVSICLYYAFLFYNDYKSKIPAREVKSIVSSWKTVVHYDFNEVDNTVYGDPILTDKGDSINKIINKEYIMRIVSTESATMFPGLIKIPLKNFYISSMIQKQQMSSNNSSCGIIFGRQETEKWFLFKFDGTNTSITQDKGKNIIPHTIIAGPKKIEGIYPDSAYKMTIFAYEGQYRFFINDMEIFAFYNDSIPSGDVDIAIQVPSGKASISCAFDDLEVRTP